MRAPRPAETRLVDQLVNAAFADSGSTVTNLVQQMRSLWRTDRGFELIASTSEGEVLGHIGFSRGYLDAPERLHHVLVLSPLAVQPSSQGRGIGSTLVRTGLQEATERGFDLVFLEGEPGFYPRLGFVPGGAAGFRKPSVRIPDAAFMVRHLTPVAESLSGTLIYPEIFWETDTVGLRDA
ncbi:hypothetical protein UM93_15070 [Psychromicrobium lacuslunae]|uniref:N-acetyltransferase domain-containing protein n=1 Tax=Psychromicrobium lacuslunae TaxID=1618207 RepID=A0A0D4C3D9_9MICC|nr:hypothetical protein UM93_15070 [Psychromicrobium lacuslunae]